MTVVLYRARPKASAIQRAGFRSVEPGAAWRASNQQAFRASRAGFRMQAGLLPQDPGGHHASLDRAEDGGTVAGAIPSLQAHPCQDKVSHRQQLSPWAAALAQTRYRMPGPWPPAICRDTYGRPHRNMLALPLSSSNTSSAICNGLQAWNMSFTAIVDTGFWF